MTGVLKERDQDPTRHRGRTLWGHTQEKAVTYKPRREASDQPSQHPDELRTSSSEERFRCFSQSAGLGLTALESNASDNERPRLVQACPCATDRGPYRRASGLPNRRHTSWCLWPTGGAPGDAPSPLVQNSSHSYH